MGQDTAERSSSVVDLVVTNCNTLAGTTHIHVMHAHAGTYTCIFATLTTDHRVF